MMAGMNPIGVLLAPSRWGLRVRSALAAAAVVGVVFLLGGAAMVLLLHRSLMDSVDAAASTRAGEVAGQLAGRYPDQLEAALFTVDSRVESVQVLDSSWHVLRASADDASKPLLARPSDPSNVVIAEGDSDLRVSVREVTGPAGRCTVLAAASSEPVEETLHKVAFGLALSGPVIVLAAAAATYGLVGRSLASVEEIRTRVAGIGAEHLSERVPVPQAEDEIARLATTMNAMLGRIEAGHAAQRRFVGDASHELRSPLATLIAALEVARDHPEVLDRGLVTATLLPEAQRMRHLIDDLLTLAATDEHGLTLRTADVDLDDLAIGVASALRSLRTVEVVTDLRPARLIGDQAALTRVIRNLVDNAATHATSAVVIGTDLVAGTVRLVVEDDGPGIPVDDRARVLERFVRLQSDRARDTGGTGLGLAIVAQIVAAHHGSIAIDDSPRGGARVEVSIPVDGPRGVG